MHMLHITYFTYDTHIT